MRQREISIRKTKRFAITGVIVSAVIGLALAISGHLRIAKENTLVAKHVSGPVQKTPDGATSASSSARSQTESRNRTRIHEEHGRLPLQFEANQGQTNSQVKFLSRGSNFNLFLTRTEAVLTLTNPSSSAKQSHRDSSDSRASVLERRGVAQPVKKKTEVLRLKLAGATGPSLVTGEAELSGKANYFIGNDPAKWKTNIPTFNKVRYGNVYPGIDLVYYGNQQHLEYDFIVAPNSDPRAIRLSFQGARGIRIDAEGNLVLRTSAGSLSQKRPVIYQQVNGQRHEIDGGYQILNQREVAFNVADYDRTRPLVIDPVLAYATYLGGGAEDESIGIAVDSAGNAYVSGHTNSLNFPEATSLSQNTSGGVLRDGFIAKLNSTGTALIYSTYIGGSDADAAIRIAVDPSGTAYVTGQTNSIDFPTTANAFQPFFGGTSGDPKNSFFPVGDAFVARLNSAGSALLYSTYLGGSVDEVGLDIAAGSTGQAYVTGLTISDNFPVTPGVVQPFPSVNFPNACDAFVTRLDTNASGAASLVYSTFLGGSLNELGFGIAIDTNGNAYVTGITDSVDFPTANPIQSTFGGGGNGFFLGGDAFVTKVNAGGTAFMYSTFLGGNDDDQGASIAVDGGGNAYVTGSTSSPNFVTTQNAYDRTCGTDGQCNPVTGFFSGVAADAFVTKLNAGGSARLYSTFLGGSSVDFAQGIAVDSSGKAHVTGATRSDEFPTTPDAFEAADNDFYNDDAFVTKLDTNGSGASSLVYSTLVATRDEEQGNGIAVDSAGNIYVTGITESFGFPATLGALQTASGGGQDGFIVKIDLTIPTQTFTVSGRVINALGAGVSGATVVLTGSRRGTTQTDAFGNYSLSVAAAGSYTLTPIKAGFVMSPYSQSFSNISADKTANFTATQVANSFSISGHVDLGTNGVEGVSSVLVRLTGTQSGSTLTDRLGNYSFINLAPGGSFTITPASSTLSFTPASLTFNSLSSNQTANFNAASVFSIFSLIKNSDSLAVTNVCVTVTDSSGRVIGTPCQPQARMSDLTTAAGHLFDPGIADAEVNCDLNSIYQFSNLPPGTFIVKPASPNYTFTPSTITVTITPSGGGLIISGGSQGTVFIANPALTGYTINGRIRNQSGAGLDNMRLLMCGTRLGKTETNTNGDYAFPGLVFGDSVRVEPSQAGMAFNPASNSYIAVTQNYLHEYTGQAAATNPIDEARAYVRQHYRDFLNREADTSGLNYWANIITNCGTDPACIHRKRIDVSAAFFIETEFQETGYYVYRLYKAPLGRQPRFSEFTADRSRLHVGPPLETDKQVLADEFVQRGEFTAAYPPTMPAEQFVNRLFDTAGLTSADYAGLRQQLVTDMNNGKSRARVLRDVIEIAEFKTREYYPAFVQMQYLGYLRRNYDQNGYNFWLDILTNRDPGNFRGMVCSFITSAEYQLRFGPAITRSNADCAQQ